MPSADADPIYCGFCGAANPSSHRFCGGCGRPLVAVTVPEPAEPLVAQEPAAATIAPISDAPPAVVGAVAVEPPFATAPPASPPKPATPQEAMARERERDRLMTLANVQRMRGQIGDARQSVSQALALSEGRPPRDLAPVHELLGDLFASEEKWDDALREFGKAHELDENRVTSERKFATLTLRLADTRGERSVADAMLRGGDSFTNLMASGPQRTRRNAGIAMLLSLVPGFGQFYNGEFIKGLVLLGTYVMCLLIITFAPGGKVLVNKFAAVLAFNAGKSGGPISPFIVLVGLVMVFVALYSLVDAPIMAGKAPKAEDGQPPIDKTGWEV